MPDSPADYLRRARIAKGFTSAAEAARRFGWSIPTFTAHENGTRGIRPDTAREYAEALDISANRLVGLSPGKAAPDERPDTGGVQSVETVGEAAWGVWREDAAPPPVAGQTVHAPGEDGERYALRIADDSLDKVMPPGDWAIYEPVTIGEPIALKVGMFVVVHKTRQELNEVTVQQVAEVGGGTYRLGAHSRNPRYNTLTTYDPNNAEGVAIRGIVTGSFHSFT